MKSVVLNGKTRENVGKKDSKNLRKEEMVPCVLYGGETPVHFATEAKNFNAILNTPETFIINIKVEGAEYNAILQDTQFHPVSDDLLHVDFLLVTEDNPVTTRVPVKVTGKSKGVLAGGKLQTKMRKLKVKGLMKDLPEFVNVDITNVALGESVQVKELSPEGYELLDAPGAVIATVKLTRGAIQAAKDAAAAEAAK
jgi:large subunit ribosomal protein L25